MVFPRIDISWEAARGPPPPTVLDPKATETTMALYQAMRATPDRLPKPRPKWKAWGPGFAWGVAVMGRV